jgi:hypothetical protein
MYLKKAVIVPDQGGSKELIDHKVNGLVYQLGDYEDLAEQIHYLIKNKNKLKLLGIKAKQKIKSIFTKKKCIDPIYQILNQIKLKNKEQKKLSLEKTGQIELLEFFVNYINLLKRQKNALSQARDLEICHNLNKNLEIQKRDEIIKAMQNTKFWQLREKLSKLKKLI